MRRFSEREKEVIRQLVNDYSKNPMQYVLINAYNDIFYKNNVEFDAVKGQLIFFRQLNNLDLEKDINPIIDYILEISLLIKYLVSVDLIVLISTKSVNELKKIGGFIKKSGDFSISVDLDDDIAKTLFESMNHRIFVSETLKVLVQDDFKSIEEKILETNINLSKKTIDLTNSTNQQNDELKEQSRHTENLFKQSKIQTGEAKRLADEAEKQTIAVQKQAKEAEQQTKYSFAALLLSILAIICSYLVARYVTMDVKIDESQYNEVSSVINKIESNTNSFVIPPIDSIYIKNKHLDVKVVPLKK